MKNLLLLLVISMPLIAFRGRVVDRAPERGSVRKEVVVRSGDVKGENPVSVLTETTESKIAFKDASGTYTSSGFIHPSFTSDVRLGCTGQFGCF